MSPILIRRTAEECEFFTQHDPYFGPVNERPIQHLLTNDWALAASVKAALPFPLASDVGRPMFDSAKHDNEVLQRLLDNDKAIAAACGGQLPNPQLDTLHPWVSGEAKIWAVDNRPLFKLLENDIYLADFMDGQQQEEEDAASNSLHL